MDEEQILLVAHATLLTLCLSAELMFIMACFYLSALSEYSMMLSVSAACVAV